jgi:hypothetical protein
VQYNYPKPLKFNLENHHKRNTLCIESSFDINGDENFLNINQIFNKVEFENEVMLPDESAQGTVARAVEFEMKKRISLVEQFYEPKVDIISSKNDSKGPTSKCQRGNNY